MRLRAVRLVTTVPLFAGAALAWWGSYEVLALVCAVAGFLLSLLQWMTVRALQCNAPSGSARPGGSLADRERRPL